MNISPEEAADALRNVAASRLAMRRALQNHRGHLHLWLWGLIWIAMSALNWRYDKAALHAVWWLCGIGLVISCGIGMFQGSQIRSRIDRRFLGVCATLLVFGYVVWPFLFGGFQVYRTAYAYFTVLWMQVYMVAGIWFDNFWFWLGLTVTVLTLASLIFLPAAFWAVTMLFGLVLVGTGFYMRFGWR
jgi:hypothetical protein